MRVRGLARLVILDTPGYGQPHGLVPRLTGSPLTLQRGPRDTSACTDACDGACAYA